MADRTTPRRRDSRMPAVTPGRDRRTPDDGPGFLRRNWLKIGGMALSTGALWDLGRNNGEFLATGIDWIGAGGGKLMEAFNYVAEQMGLGQIFNANSFNGDLVRGIGSLTTGATNTLFTAFGAGGSLLSEIGRQQRLAGVPQSTLDTGPA